MCIDAQNILLNILLPLFSFRNKTKKNAIYTQGNVVEFKTYVLFFEQLYLNVKNFYAVEKLVFAQGIYRICHFVASCKDAIHNIFDG